MRGNTKLLLASVLAGVLAVPVGAAAETTADGGSAQTAKDAEEAQHRREAQRGEQLRLDCRGFQQEGRDGVACGWSPSKQREFAGYRLMRHERAQREPVVVFATRDRAQTKTVDATVAPDRDYLYLVQVLDARGRVIGTSNPVRVHTGKPRPTPPRTPPALPAAPTAVVPSV